MVAMRLIIIVNSLDINQQSFLKYWRRKHHKMLQNQKQDNSHLNRNVQVTEQGLWSSLHPRLISLTVNIIIIVILFIVIIVVIILFTGDGLHQRSRRMHLCNHTTSPRSL